MTEQQNEIKRLRQLLLALAIGAVLGLFACYLYFYLVQYFPSLAPGCTLSRVTHLYCPGCGGTRATAALLRGDVVASLRANPIVVYLVGMAVCLYLRAWWHVYRGRPERVTVPAWSWIVLIVLALGVCAVRNVLMVRFGVDTLGENLAYWHA